MTNIELAEGFYRAFDLNQPELLNDVLATDWKALPPVPGNPGGLAGQSGDLSANQLSLMVGLSPEGLAHDSSA